MQGVGMPRYCAMVAEARAKGELQIEKGALGWKYRKAKPKAKAKARKAKAAPRRKASSAPSVDLFELCRQVELGEKSVESLVSYAGEGLSVADILNWYVNEGIARDLAERRGEG